jgi:anti-sigma-K factor RskA
MVPRSSGEYKIKGSRPKKTGRARENVIGPARFVLSSRQHPAMDTQAPGFDQRLSDLEAHIDRLTHSLEHWRETQDQVEPMERRLAQLTDQCAAILKQWTATGERHAHAVGELETRLTGWNDIEARLQRDASFRFQALERAIESEWASLRSLHEEPTRQLRSQAESLTEICVTTAGSAQTGLERAEARLALLESDLHRRMDDLARDLQAAVAELRHRVDPGALKGPARPWQLDEVTRLHQELRDEAARGPASNGSGHESSTQLSRPLTIFDSAVSGAPASEPSHEHHTAAAPPPARSTALWLVALTLLGVIGFGAGIFAYSFYRQAGAAASQAAEAQQQTERIATSARDQIESARQEAAHQIAQARETASRAQVTSDVLAAPDLIRFALIGGTPEARYGAQFLWSRSRGMVFSGSRLPAPPQGSMYQIWLLTAGDPVSAGTFVPDAAGRVTEATDKVPSVPRPITGVRVTLEPAPGKSTPSGTVVLSRAQ